MLLTLLLACTSEKSGCHSGDTQDSCSPPPELPAQLLSESHACTASDCTYKVTTQGPVGAITLTLTDTGIETWTCGLAKGQPVCGSWEETHSAFLTESETETERVLALTLSLASGYEDQVDNQSTAFGDAETQARISYLYQAVDAFGEDINCLKGGQNPSYFADKCPD